MGVKPGIREEERWEHENMLGPQVLESGIEETAPQHSYFIRNSITSSQEQDTSPNLMPKPDIGV